MDNLIYSLNKHALKRTHDYMHLNIHGKNIRCPFYMNHLEAEFVKYMKKVGMKGKEIEIFWSYIKKRELNFGWYKGKGKPEEIIKSTIEISQRVGLPLDKAESKVILDFMKMYGLGIDCSGFVFETLRYAFNKAGLEKNFLNSLKWKDKNLKTSTRAGVFIFSDKASEAIDPKDINPLDLILIKGCRNNYSHIALILYKKGLPFVVQSNFSYGVSGVNLTRLMIKNNKPVFEYKPQIEKSWEELFKTKQLEFRRLSILINS